MTSTMISKPLFEAPRPYFTADFNNYFTLLRETLHNPLQYILENEPVFFYVESGHGLITVNGVDFSLEPGCGGLLQTYHVYSISAADPNPLCLTVIVMDYPLQIYCSFQALDPKMAEDSYELPPVICLSQENQAKMQTLLNKCQREELLDDRQSPLIKTALYSQICLLLRQLTHEQKEKAGPWPLGWAAWVYLTKFCQTRIGPAEAAAEFGVTVSRLNRELRRISSYDCRRLLARARVKIAASMLLFDDLSMLVISSNVGFTSENSFYRCFKEWWGMTPQEYRRQMLSGNVRHRRQKIYERPWAILNYISSNYRKEITVKTAAQTLFLSEDTINQIMIDFFHVPFHQMVLRWRMLNAQALLRCTTLPVCDIADELGFHSIHTFSRLFKKRFHMSPGQYRKEAKQHESI